MPFHRNSAFAFRAFRVARAPGSGVGSLLGTVRIWHPGGISQHLFQVCNNRSTLSTRSLICRHAINLFHSAAQRHLAQFWLCTDSPFCRQAIFLLCLITFPALPRLRSSLVSHFIASISHPPGLHTFASGNPGLFGPLRAIRAITAALFIITRSATDQAAIIASTAISACALRQ